MAIKAEELLKRSDLGATQREQLEKETKTVEPVQQKPLENLKAVVQHAEGATTAELPPEGAGVVQTVKDAFSKLVGKPQDDLQRVVLSLMKHFKIMEGQLSSISQTLKSIATVFGMQQKQGEQGQRELKLEQQKDDVKKESAELFTPAQMKGKGVFERTGMKMSNLSKAFSEGLKDFVSDMLMKFLKIGVALLVGGAIYSWLPKNVQAQIKAVFKGLLDGIVDVFPGFKSFRDGLDNLSKFIGDLKRNFGIVLTPLFASINLLVEMFNSLIKLGKRVGWIKETPEEKTQRERTDFIYQAGEKARTPRPESLSNEFVPETPMTQQEKDKEQIAVTKAKNEAAHQWDADHPKPAAPTPTSKPAAVPSQGSTKDIEEMTPEGRNLLDRIASTEGKDYNALYGVEKFDSYADHPRKKVTYKGVTSDTAGRYQFKPGTWDIAKNDLHLKDFSPANQDKAAWYTAQKDFKARTGKSLQDTLKRGDFTEVARGLNQTWTSLPGGKEENKKYRNAPQVFSQDYQAHRGVQTASLQTPQPTSAVQVEKQSEAVAPRLTPAVSAPPIKIAAASPLPAAATSSSGIGMGTLPTARANRGSLDRDIYLSTLVASAG